MKIILLPLIFLFASNSNLYSQNISGEWIGEGFQPGTAVPNSYITFNLIQKGNSVSGTTKSVAIYNTNYYCTYSVSGTFDGKTFRFHSGSPIDEGNDGNFSCCRNGNTELIFEDGNQQKLEGSGEGPGCPTFTIKLKKESNCKYPLFDKDEPITTYNPGGYVVEGSYDFLTLVREALIKLKSTSPDLYKQYIHSSNYTDLKGIKIECERGTNHTDKDMFVRLAIPTLEKYNFYLKCPEITASIILHESKHVFQASSYMRITGKGFDDFLKEFGKSLQTQQNYEKDALRTQLEYLNKAYLVCNCKSDLKIYKDWVYGLYSGSYPDMNNDGKRDIRDDEIMIKQYNLQMTEIKSNTPLINNETLAMNILGYVKTKEGSDLRLRSAPSIKASIIAQIPNGSTVNILEYSDKIVELNGEMGKWCKVDYDGKIGWVWEKFIEITISQAIVQTKSGYVKTKEGSDLRLRSAPSEKASIITQIANGSKVIILEKDDHFVTVNGDVGQWLKVKYEGTIGWAWGKFIIQN